jgi:hypothetical protein
LGTETHSCAGSFPKECKLSVKAVLEQPQDAPKRHHELLHAAKFAEESVMPCYPWLYVVELCISRLDLVHSFTHGSSLHDETKHTTYAYTLIHNLLATNSEDCMEVTLPCTYIYTPSDGTS